MADLCGKVYERIVAGELQPAYIRCTYVEGHTARCSWETVRVVDEAERESITIDLRDAPTAVRDVVRLLETGKWDRWLELILSAGHDRKRTRRGVAGFPRRAA